MSTRHKIIATCPFAFEGIEVEVTFNYKKGRGPTGPTYASGGEPGYGPEVELVAVKPIDPALVLPPNLQADLSDWADQWLADEGYDAACDVAADDEIEARERAAEMRAEMRREP